MPPKFNVGDEVQSVNDPSRIGTVVEICEIHAGIQYYRVNFGSGKRPVIGEVDLRQFVSTGTPGENLSQGKIDGYQEFQRLMTHQRLIRDYPLRNNIYAFNASRTRFYPYQFKPLLKFLDSPKHRMLIADEVGLGKTIEAGLILTELKARQTVQRVLVVCPANLTEKWKFELKKRFGEEFEILNARRFMNFLHSYEESPYVSLNGIISLESIRQQRILETLEALSPSFDLVIVDEAHHMRNFGRKQRKVGVLLSPGADAMLLLTATPIHLGNENLFSLLNILDNEEFPDLYTVDYRFRENEPIVRTQICMGQIPPNTEEAQKLIKEFSKSPFAKKRPQLSEISDKLNTLANNEVKKEQSRRLTLDIQRDLAELNLLGHIFNRTKKRDVELNMGVRRVFPLKITLTDIEKIFYEAVTDYVREESSRRTDANYIEKWILHMPQRRMASSMPAMVEHYRKHFGLSKDDLSEDHELIDESADDIQSDKFEFQSAEERLRSIIDVWPSNGFDSKYHEFIKILKELRKKEGRLKVMVFAFFKGTLNYIHRRLAEDGFGSVIISGDVPPALRIEIIEKFREKPELEILLSSKVGSEGLDFQFCNIMFNYDLPWNPMEVEQRIGRLDRIGQESKTIRIYNFWIKDTIEERILNRLYLRIGIFEKSIGELEMIIGDELSTLERDILSKKLSPKEEEKLIERKVQAIERRSKELFNLEKKSAEFIGTDQFFDEEIQKIKLHRRYITCEQMRRFFVDFIRTNCPRTHLSYDPKTNKGKLKPDERMRSLLSTHDRTGETIRFLNIIGDEISITFDSQTAFDNPNIEFINVLHPLTQAISKFYSEESAIQSNVHHVVLKTNKLSPDFYIYFIFRLRVRSARSRNTLEMIILDQNLKVPISDEDIEIIFGEMVEKGEDLKGRAYELDKLWTQRACQEAEKIFLKRIAGIRGEAARNNDVFINLRLESIESSYGKNLKMKRGLLEKAERDKKKERYIRMLKGSIRNLEFELKEKKRGLENQRKIEVEYDEIAAGILEAI